MEKTNTLVKDRQHATAETAVTAVSDDSSQPFVGRWNHLVSTTNWEKGRIIAEWRQALIDADRPARECTDEAWSRLVGFVTGQHTGRLRRVYERFGKTCQEYRGLYWSHFHAALDWDDAEMWLEGAVESKWTVSQMRRQRWEATGAVESERPVDEEIVVAELDEDIDPRWLVKPPPNACRRSGPKFKGRRFRKAPISATRVKAKPQPTPAPTPLPPNKPRTQFRSCAPFANLAELPEDLADAFEAFKLAILRHKAEGWRQVSLDDVTGALESLKELAWAPSVD